MSTASISSPVVNSAFPGCQFRNGRNYDQPGTDYSQYDYISIWINTPGRYLKVLINFYFIASNRSIKQ